MLRTRRFPLLFRSNRPSAGPSVDLENPKLRTSLHIMQRQSDYSFDVDGKGQYWRIKPVNRHALRRAGKEGQNLNNLRAHQNTRRTLMTEALRRNMDEDDNGASTVTVNVLEDAKFRGRAFCALAFHHYLHGVEGRDVHERSPLLVRGAMLQSFDADKFRAQLFQHASSSAFLRGTSPAPPPAWRPVSEQLLRSVAVPFAVTDHVSADFAALSAAASSDGEAASTTAKDDTASAAKARLLEQQRLREEEVYGNPIMAPVAPFSRRARHARLIGKSLDGAGPKQKEEDARRTDQPPLLAWSDAAGDNGGTSALHHENIIVCGDGALIECTVSRLPSSSPSPSSAQPRDSRAQRRVFIGCGDALYVPVGWQMNVVSVKATQIPALLSTTMTDKRQNANHNQSAEEAAAAAATAAALSSTPPYLLRFAYRPFPGTGPRSRRELGLRQYVGGEWASSCSAFYSRPITDVLSLSGAAMSGAAGSRPLHTRPMNA